MNRRPLKPLFRELSAEESEALVRRNHVGRLAFSFRDIVDIRPIHYVFEGKWIFGRTSSGEKLLTLQHNQWVAFEVDEVEGLLNWQSVVVRGTFYPLKNQGSVHDVRLYEAGINAIRSFALDAFTDHDPLGFRSELFGISVDSVTGRSCSTQAG